LQSIKISNKKYTRNENLRKPTPFSFSRNTFQNLKKCLSVACPIGSFLRNFFTLSCKLLDTCDKQTLRTIQDVDGSRLNLKCRKSCGFYAAAVHCKRVQCEQQSLRAFQQEAFEAALNMLAAEQLLRWRNWSVSCAQTDLSKRYACHSLSCEPSSNSGCKSAEVHGFLVIFFVKAWLQIRSCGSRGWIQVMLYPFLCKEGSKNFS